MIKDALGERVSDVRASQRLTSSASCLVAGGDGPRPRARAAVGAAEPRRGYEADPRGQHAPSDGGGDFRRHRTRPKTSRCCFWSRRKSSMANCRKIRPRLPEAQSAGAAGDGEGERLISSRRNFRSCQAIGRKLVHCKSALLDHWKGEPRLACEHDQSPVSLCSLQQKVDLDVREAIMQIFHISALCKQRIGLVKQQHCAIGPGLGEDALEFFSVSPMNLLITAARSMR